MVETRLCFVAHDFGNMCDRPKRKIFEKAPIIRGKNLYTARNFTTSGDVVRCNYMNSKDRSRAKLVWKPI